LPLSLPDCIGQRLEVRVLFRLLHLDAPRTVDAVQLAQVTGPQLTSTERIRVVLDQLMDRNRTIDGEVIKEDGDG
jgi:hypothetical protein